jgi:hypothetical protein
MGSFQAATLLQLSLVATTLTTSLGRHFCNLDGTGHQLLLLLHSLTNILLIFDFPYKSLVFSVRISTAIITYSYPYQYGS